MAKVDVWGHYIGEITDEWGHRLFDAVDLNEWGDWAPAGPTAVEGNTATTTETPQDGQFVSEDTVGGNTAPTLEIGLEGSIKLVTPLVEYWNGSTWSTPVAWFNETSTDITIPFDPGDYTIEVAVEDDTSLQSAYSSEIDFTAGTIIEVQGSNAGITDTPAEGVSDVLVLGSQANTVISVTTSPSNPVVILGEPSVTTASANGGSINISPKWSIAGRSADQQDSAISGIVLAVGDVAGRQALEQNIPHAGTIVGGADVVRKDADQELVVV